MSEDWKTRLAEGPLSAVRALESCTAGELTLLTENYAFRGALAAACKELTGRAYAGKDRTALAEMHELLALIYDRDFSGVVIGEVDHERAPLLRDVAAILEAAMLGEETARIDEETVTGYPRSGTEYVRWLKNLVNDHPAGRHPLYHEHIEQRGTREDLRLLLAQETSLDPRFDDILASMQMGRTGGEKMEIAANYWDEMGNGDAELVHTSLFSQALESIGADPAFIRDSFMLEAGICGNLSACLGLARRHYYKAVGYFGVTEYLAPRRFRCVVDTWRRLGLHEVGITYHDLHIGIDAGHASGWFKNVVAPLVDGDPLTGRDIALGAMIRLNTSQDYLDELLRRMRGRSPVAVGAQA
ncbi:Iron-containing redox enzyme [Streptomyces sp. 2224.1]|uniref:iron-containing redox enzyme family protein n=1 Tax=unclassified Streptomyces TaxID=2593676 RepID=UPI00087E5A1A|nr:MULTISPECIES: iron-containing redox enzyme family protein [unclassified Streptomyces]PBC83654.1 heme oxygenase-like protein [Streptomyces sp. 2321.6]SDR40291.1 Iron-containing redox enzyme [Streptomyces sp. KS_16]SEB98945.1 Iron-containing redox enzyme [Streptomyces sp. 2224.1]SED03599.1 Iron-containing redox enzyme [Streptomyces sp. 2133.1]SEE72595.1 Iron-containing redox enzyme [Streptomyces sp. 2112.3]